MRWSPLVLVVVLALGGCAGGGDDDTRPSQSSRATASSASPDGSTSAGVAAPALRDELLEMARQDQAERTGGGGIDDDPRIARLKEIIAEHGWPTYDLVGRKAADAAWLIAQHADLDPEFQREALELLRAAVEAEQASAGNLAYLTDRVAAGAGEPQSYGTQVACTPSGPKPGTTIADRSGLEERRAAAGLEPYEKYLRQMTRICAEDASG
jgi:hypothetical protein